MKKKNLNFLLALLAALALVFAGACSDGSDDSSSSEPETQYIEIEYDYESDYSGTTWLASLHASNHADSAGSAEKDSVDTVTLEFAESGNGVTITVGYTICAYTSDHNSDSTYTEEIDATYTALGSRVGILLPVSNASTETSELTLTVSESSTGGGYDTLTLTAVSSTPATATYKVGDDDTEIDIFDAANLAEALEEDDTFTKQGS